MAVVAAALLALAAALIPAGAGAVTLPFKPAAQQGVFLHVSDIHFDPFINKKVTADLIQAPVEKWEGILRGAQGDHFSRHGRDTNNRLFVSMLAAAKGTAYDYVLNTGDNLAHKFREKFDHAKGVPSDYRNFVIKTLRFVNYMLKKSFPGAPLIYAVGNNDSVCGDYRVAPHSTMLAQLGRDLPVVAGNAAARKDFAIGGFYAVPHPTVARHDMIVLNSIFWSAKYWDNCNRKAGDPGAAELDWLGWMLYWEKLAGRTATLVMHIPPGINAYKSADQRCPQSTSFWQNGYTRRFLALAAEYKDVLRDGFAGHTHMDSFSVLSDRSGTPLLATRITPSVSPYFDNNPAFTVLLYDRGDATVRDYATFYLSNLASAGSNTPGQWKLEYDFAQTYGTRSYTAAGLKALAESIRAKPSVRQTFIDHYAVDVSPPPKIKPDDEDNWLAYACTQTALTPDAYAACRCPGARQR